MEIEQLLALLGVDLPRVLGINFLCGAVKTWLEGQGLWETVGRWYVAAPFVAAFVLSLVFESGSIGVALKSAAVYGSAAVALHNFRRTAIQGR